LSLASRQRLRTSEIKFFFLFFPWKERTKGTSEKGYDSEKAKVPKSKKRRNERVHFFVFCFWGQGTVGAEGLIIC